MIDKSHISCHSELDSESIRLRSRNEFGMTILLKSFFRSFKALIIIENNQGEG